MSKLNLSAIFKSAHKLAKQVIKSGDNYSATFSACLKITIANAKSALKAHYKQLEAVTALYAEKGLTLVLCEVLSNGTRLYNAYKSNFTIFDYGIIIDKIKV